ncbi:uncharacterized protein LOC110934047 [Helianthus annuus]|uniref:uncharacterized protein LOC110934047 n=1 Tax=Helianthus annuus TaxID=4232 RepID=UPI000B8F873C|nr:uncharacterized protein LOC110934047 [Helianthus annuus]
MGFPDIWCNWIWGILNSARSSVLVYGSPTFEFKCEKGMRHGDPISPFIFLLVMEALSCMLDKAKEEGILKGIKTPNDGPSISHLLYADDAIILWDWLSENVLNVVRILRVFYMCSGLKINLSKSNLYGMGVEGWEVEEKVARVGCKADKLPFRYLGLMVGANMSNINNWKPVYDVFEARLSKWKADSLSIGGSGQEKFGWQWKRPLAPGPESEDLIQLLNLLDSFVVFDSKDKWVWLGDGSGDFSVGAVKRTLVKGRGSDNFSRFKWCRWVHAKCNIFAWRTGLGGIPTVEALRRRNINLQDLSCGFCNEGEDTVGHLFTECLAANVVWNSISMSGYADLRVFVPRSYGGALVLWVKGTGENYPSRFDYHCLLESLEGEERSKIQ